MIVITVTCLDSLSENLTVQTILSALYRQGYDPITMESQFSPRSVTEHLRILKRRNIDGVVLFDFTGIAEEVLVHWQSSLILLTCDVKGFASVYYGDERAVGILVQWLYDQGHCNIDHLGVPHSDVTTGK